MKVVVLILGVVAAALAVPVLHFEKSSGLPTRGPGRLGAIYKFCNKTVDPFIINSISFKPDPPVKGQDLTITVSYDLTELITGGNIKVTAKVDGIPLYDNTLDLCDTISEVGVPCPVKPFAGTNSTTQGLPDIGGHIEATAEVKDQNGKELACMELDVHL